MTSRSEPELVEIRKAAEALAKDRGERFSTAHVLAALAGRPGDVAQLLADRRLDQDTLLRAARVASDTTPDALARAVTRARDFAQRAVQRAPLAKGELDKRAPTALHLLFALMNNDSTYIKDWKYVYDGNIATNRKNNHAFNDKTFTTVIDYFYVSPNVEVVEVKGHDFGFKNSDHNPVSMKVRLK